MILNIQNTGESTAYYTMGVFFLKKKVGISHKKINSQKKSLFSKLCFQQIDLAVASKKSNFKQPRQKKRKIGRAGHATQRLFSEGFMMAHMSAYSHMNKVSAN